MSSGHSESAGGHGGGWLAPVVLVAYALAVFAAWALGDLSPWVFIIGTLAPIGLMIAGWHIGEGIEHLHLVHVHHLVLVVIFCLFLVPAGYVFLPVWEWRDILTPEEVRVYMWGGLIGIPALAAQVGMLFHSPGRQTILAILTGSLMIGLYFQRPEGARFLDEEPSFPSVTLPSIPPGPTLTQTFPPTAAAPSNPPTAAAPAAKALPAGTKVGPAGYAPVECSDLSYRERKKRGC